MWIWIRFDSPDGDSWAGSFRAGRVAEWTKVVFADDWHAFVLAAGVCYSVDAEQRQLVGTLSGETFVDVLSIPDGDLVAVADEIRVVICNPSGVLWTTDRIAWDGIRLLVASKDMITGVAETAHGPMEERPFTIDLSTGTVTGGYTEYFSNRP